MRRLMTIAAAVASIAGSAEIGAGGIYSECRRGQQLLLVWQWLAWLGRTGLAWWLGPRRRLGRRWLARWWLAWWVAPLIA